MGMVDDKLQAFFVCGTHAELQAAVVDVAATRPFVDGGVRCPVVASGALGPTACPPRRVEPMEVLRLRQRWYR